MGEEKSEALFSLSQQIKDLHTQETSDNHWGQDHGEQLTEASRLVEPFGYKISAGKWTTAHSTPPVVTLTSCPGFHSHVRSQQHANSLGGNRVEKCTQNSKYSSFLSSP
jgi:hypothetical protein